jgi:NADPH:quinone reductase-like Zn-dependent oxidoreductase
MQAMVIKHYGSPDQLVLREVPKPVPQVGEVLVKVRALGINRAEAYMRSGAWGEVAPISGIECVGEVEDDPSGTLLPGQVVVAMMGGMGRTRNGSYAEYTCVPLPNVIPITTSLDWADLAAIPESYATAWYSLFSSLHLRSGEILFVRGGTSALGLAAINIATAAGITVWSSTRSESKAPLLTKMGATRVLIENGKLSEEIRATYPDGIDGVLEILGNRTLFDSARMARVGGRVCVLGFLGGHESVDFDWLEHLPFGVNLTSFASFMFGTKDFPLSAVPLQQIVDHAASGTYQAKPVKVLRFDQLAEAHRLMEANETNGKIVVVCG